MSIKSQIDKWITYRFNTQHTDSCSTKRSRRVFEERQKVIISNVIQNLITLSKLEKMKYVVINNKWMINKSKVKRAQQFSKGLSNHKFFPNIQQLRIQRKNKPIKQHRQQYRSLRKNQQSNNLSDTQDQKQKQYQRLINEFIEQAKQQKLFQSFNSKEEIINYAIKKIKRKINKKYSLAGQQIKQNDSLFGKKILERVKTHNITQIDNKSRKSLSEVEYMDKLTSINKNMKLFEKKRQQKQKVFLRKIKLITQTNKSKNNI